MEKQLCEFCKEVNNTSVDEEARSGDRYMDILLTLIDMIDTGQIDSLLNPETIMIDDDDKIRIGENSDMDLLYSAPEVLFNNGKYDEKAQLFSLGLIIYYMLHSGDYYTAARLKILDIEAIQKKQPDFLIDRTGNSNGAVPREYYERLRKVMKYLTAWDPERRQEGLKLLIEMYSGIESVNIVYYMNGNTPVGRTKVTTKDDIKGFPVKNDVIYSDGKQYRFVEKIDIPYRPGKHSYRIQVSEL